MDRSIFKKEFKNIDIQIKKLKTLEGREDIDQPLLLKDINALIKGDNGESKVAFQLRNICKGIYCFHNIKLRYGDDCLQCDFIVISKGCIYVLENKNWKGNITFLQTGTAIRNINKGDEAMGNPYGQSKRQADNLKYILIQQKLITDDFEVKPLVVISNKYSIIKYDKTYQEIKDSILYCEDLNIYFDKEISKEETQNLTDNDIDNISEFLIRHNAEEPLLIFNENKYRMTAVVKNDNKYTNNKIQNNNFKIKKKIK